jgi:hypothetical protein
MKTLLLATALAVIGFATAARAGSVTVGDITITQIPAQNTTAFDTASTGAYEFITSICSPAPLVA